MFIKIEKALIKEIKENRGILPIGKFEEFIISSIIAKKIKEFDNKINNEYKYSNSQTNSQTNSKININIPSVPF